MKHKFLQGKAAEKIDDILSVHLPGWTPSRILA